MAYRHKMSRRSSKRFFAHSAGATQSVNLKASPMRGGYRF